MTIRLKKVYHQSCHDKSFFQARHSTGTETVVWRYTSEDKWNGHGPSFEFYPRQLYLNAILDHNNVVRIIEF